MIVRLFFILVILICPGLIPGISRAECQETFIIDTTEYSVPLWWCGHRLDSAALADPSELVRLPEKLCYADFRIYVRPGTRDALVTMAKSAANDSVFLVVKSGYRSLWYQRRLIKNRLEKEIPIDDILRLVAPPGYSEHHTGRAVDFVTDGVFFGKSAEYQWLKENAASFGFVESFPKDTSRIIHWEPWHWYLPPEKHEISE